MEIRDTGTTTVTRRVKGENIEMEAHGIEISDNGWQWRPIGLEGALTVSEMIGLRDALQKACGQHLMRRSGGCQCP